jgi:hypothetical protein
MHKRGERKVDATLHREVDQLWELWASKSAPASHVVKRASSLLDMPQLPVSVRLTLQALVLAARQDLV